MLTNGTRVGAYEISGSLGAGGMGEVYRARDTRLGRDVALKVLPERLAADLDRIARFEREAQVLASLNHPHIAQIYGLEHAPAGSGRALVMELVEGETLEEILARGAMAIDEALPIAQQIAEALEAAHEQGIIHRDLKPANIKITPDHVVKVLDFGLAKLVEPGESTKGRGDGNGEGGGASFARAAAQLASNPAMVEPRSLSARPPRTADTQSPTALHPAVSSSAGMLLGTAAYMSPEQARGRPADRRSDVWSFGCVLFEMLTGKRAFPGDDIADTLAAILRSEPAWNQLPSSTPDPIRRVLRRALVKDRRRRLADMATVRLEIEDALGEPVTAPAVVRGTRYRWLPWGVAVASLMLLTVFAGVIYRRPASVLDGVYRAQIVPPAELAGAAALRFALSPDGTRIAFVAPDAEGRVMLWVRRLESLTSQSLADTGGATAPFWSPDSRSVAFFAGGKLKTIELEGGAVQALADAAGVPPGVWTGDTILFANGSQSPLFRIPAAGGTPQPITTLDQKTGETAHVFPSMLPDGRHFIFHSTSGQSSRGTWIGSLDSKERTRLLDEGTNATYAGGYIFYMRETTLLAQPFDTGRLAFTGDPVAVAEDVQVNTIGGRLGAFSLSGTGVLAYQSGGGQAPSRLTWFTRGGQRLESITETGEFADVAISPNRQYAATSLVADSGANPDIWLFDTKRGMRARMTFGASSMRPVWSADGRRVAYSVRTADSWDIHWKTIDGSGAEEPLLATPADEHPLSFSPDGRYLLYASQGSPTRNSLWVLPLSGDRKPFVFVGDVVNNASAEFSPDGRRVAYVSNETGRNEVFVAAFPPPGGKWQVSTMGGTSPRWRRDGRELYFMSPDRMLTAVPVAIENAGLATGIPQPLFEVPRTGPRSPYDVEADGERFLINAANAQQSITPITLLVNWPGVVSRKF